MFEKDDIVNGRWKIVDKLTTDSGQGHTFKVIDLDDLAPTPNLFFVLKVLQKQNEQSLNRFKDEIRASLTLSHPNIAAARDSLFENADIPYLVTTYYEGGELTAAKIEHLSPRKKLEMFRTLCETVAYAHRKGVIHRDLKPRNIFLRHAESIEPIIGDFGLCFFKDELVDDVRKTAVHEPVGGKDFRPPEADFGLVEDMEANFDTYSLGKLLFWFISDGRLVPRESYADSRLDLRSKNSDHWMFRVYDIFAKSIREKPSDRYKDASEMLADVDGLLEFIDKESRYLDCHIPQSCIFCRNGQYQFSLDPNTTTGQLDYSLSQRLGSAAGQNMQNMGLNISSYPGVLIGLCDNCGNLQYFHLQFTGRHLTTTRWKSLPQT